MGEVRRICPFVGVMTGVRLSATDPIGCPITISEMLDYLRPLLSFEVSCGDCVRAIYNQEH